MDEHPIQSLIKTSMESIKEMVDVNTIVGDAVETADGSVIIPVSRVSFGLRQEVVNSIKRQKKVIIINFLLVVAAVLEFLLQ